ncbi:sensor histidine kinase [Lutibaculum baratangense]|uniref:Blue-light-activated histidine kinase n=1 Tax=Lutibaculum baratangense AMV1 TaxID=631454 RepID=V4RN86_9HYPH|nr:PAS domain-containing protein [Lutibaculum baratangense]ESR26749.1 PAS sensor protein [Lutibaculum baratangense AMV1]
MPFERDSLIDADVPHDWDAERTKLVIDASGMGTFDYDLRTGALEWSDRCKALFGVPVEQEVSYPRFLEALHPDDRETTDQIVRDSIDPEGDGAYRAEYRVIHPDSQIRWISAQGRTYFAVEDGRKRPIRMLGTAFDITPRKATEAAIREQSERQQAALLASRTGTFRWSIETHEVDWDRTLAKLFGRPEQPLVTSLEEFLAHVHEADRDVVREQCRRCATEGANFDMEFRIVSADGSERWLLGQGRTQADARGAASYMTGACVDITDRKEAEAALRMNEARFRAIADSMPQMLWSTQPDGFHDYFNRRWYEYTGVQPGSTDGVGWNDMFHPDDRDRAWEIWRRSLETGEDYEIEYRLRRQDGAYRWVLGRARPVRDEATGEIVRWFGTCTDIEETKRAEQELKEAFEAREALLYEVNHRVKNSLAVVMSLLTLQAGRTKDEDLKQSLMEARGRIAVVAQVHQRLYTSSRHDSVELGPFLIEVANDVEGLLDTESRVHLALDVDATGTVLSIDKAVPLALIVSELLTNSMKYAFPDGVEGTIRLAVEESEDGLCVVVEDDGVGLPPGFELSKSTGFGMRIVSALSRQIRGRVTVPPTPRGTRFEIFLPSSEEEDD